MEMGVRTFYRLTVWLPLVLPSLLAAVRWKYGWSAFPEPLHPFVGMLLGTLVYGGIPYLFLALWATWRIGSLTEPEIKKLILRSPFLMLGVFTLFWFLAGLRVGRPEFVMLGPFAAIFILTIGYGYMGVVLLIREELGERLH